MKNENENHSLIKTKGQGMNIREIHYRYVISYLVVAIIGILALYFFKVTDLVDKLSFALTLSSLLLAVLAIFYTIISANKQDNQFSKLIETHSELKLASSEIRNASVNINNLISEIPRHFNRLNAKIDSISENFSSLPPKVLDEKSSEKTTIEITELKIDKTVLHKMVLRLQYTAMGVLYLFTESYSKNKNIDFSLFEQLDLLSYQYAIGILNGFETTGLIGFKIHDNPHSIIPTKCDQLLMEEMSVILGKVVEVINDEKEKERVRTIINSINDLHD